MIYAFRDVDPKFVKICKFSKIIKDTFTSYIDDINNNEFPKEEHLYSLMEKILKKIRFSTNFKDN